MNNNKSLELLYQENAKVAAIFWEWRHKIMTAFFTIMGGLFVLVGWFYQEKELRDLFFAPLFLGAVLSIALFALDVRNARILRECYKIGGALEKELQDDKKGAIFDKLNTIRNSRFSYTYVLQFVFLAVGLLLLIVSAMSFLYKWPSAQQ